MDTQQDYNRASMATADDLRSIAQNLSKEQLSQLSLPEVDAVVEAVAKVVPAGNVPGLILSGLARLPGNAPQEKNIKRDIKMLFRGVDQVMDKAVYSAFFAGPAAVIWGYQNILKLAGKDPDAAFPEGTWQFYVDYALREDTARHTNETHGFDSALRQHNIQLDDVDRMTAWVMTAIHTLHQYDVLLANEWRERVYCRLLLELDVGEAHIAKFSKVYSRWQGQLPYRRQADARADENYPAYRKRKFDEFFSEPLNLLSPEQKAEWLRRVQEAKTEHLPAYQQQMSILGYLEPDAYAEVRTNLALKQLYVGLVYEGCYYLLPVCQAGTSDPPEVASVREQVAAIVAHPSEATPAGLSEFAQIQRSNWLDLRKKLSDDFVQQLDMLRLSPILLNFDPRPHDAPLAELRQGERGIGDHALTIFDTRETFAFDQSHIYFDGAWGVALAEIMTNEALSWAIYLRGLAAATPTGERPYSPPLLLSEADHSKLDQASRVTPEVAAETDRLNIKSTLSLRRLFKQRSDLLTLTVNDLLVLYRAIHAISYQPDPALVEELEALRDDNALREAAEEALVNIQPEETPPAILIPVDASQRSPRDRLYPMSFEVPLADLELLNLHDSVMDALDEYEGTAGNRDEAYARFDEYQRHYLASLAGFGQVLSRAKEIANRGESASVSSIKLLAHMPMPLQNLLDTIPGQFDVLNDILKGREVFSNVGRVAPSSTLTRFVTAKDDNDKKTLAWGVLTDAKGVMRLSLRDFRPHVKMLLKVGQVTLAQHLAQDYLDAYVQGFNDYIKDLHRMTVKSRETRMVKW